jgi:hypothetical protein
LLRNYFLPPIIVSRATFSNNGSHHALTHHIVIRQNQQTNNCRQKESFSAPTAL